MNDRQAAREEELAADLYPKLAAAYPSWLHWDDRRAIGALHLAASETRLHSRANPRGWFAGPTGGVDVTNAAGIAAFRRRILKYADESVGILKAMNAQGMITWALEGEEYPQATTYIGDPRLLGKLAPEMDAIAALLFDKILYVNRRWGCTIFYVDSNGDPNVPYDPTVFEILSKRLAAARISALVLPEHRNMRYYAYTAPYASLARDVAGAPDTVRLAYPRAFFANYVPDRQIGADHGALVKAVRSGDILLFRAWWDDPVNAEVNNIYAEAENVIKN